VLAGNTPHRDGTAHSVGAALKLPCCFEGILNGTSVASGEVSDNHHVLTRNVAAGPARLTEVCRAGG
jgi:hypothetical protein